MNARIEVAPGSPADQLACLAEQDRDEAAIAALAADILDDVELGRDRPDGKPAAQAVAEWMACGEWAPIAERLAIQYPSQDTALEGMVRAIFDQARVERAAEEMRLYGATV